MKIIPLALIALTLSGGVALADRDRGRGRDMSHRSGGTMVTPSRGHDRVRPVRQDRVRQDNRRWDNSRRYDNRRYNNNRHDRVVNVQRSRPTFRNNRFYFAGGHYQAYQRPVIQYRYRNYAHRPALIVENIQPVSGYIWVQGNWQWDGFEWQWMPGHYAVDQNYQEPYYDGYQDPYYNGYQEPYYNGGVSVQGGWTY